jgi:hypothetical protein
MKVLVACEFSGIVRDAFIRHGHDAWSCDLLPSERPGPHYQSDIMSVLSKNLEWDLMIAHPPCTHLAVSGARYFKGKEKLQREAIQFVYDLWWKTNIPRICMENPVSILSTWLDKPDQYIQPYNFGHDASKKTCLWLKNLPLLNHTKYIEPRIVDGKKRWANQTDSGQNRLTPSEHRAGDRSRTYEGIADAMANQWGNL